MVIGTPEYTTLFQRFWWVPSWLSYGLPLLNKPAAILGHRLGSSRAQLQLRHPNAPEIKANVLPDEFCYLIRFFDQNGDLVDLDVIQKIDAIFNDFRIFVKITDKIT